MPDDGIVTSEKWIELSCTNANAKIYYTIDGSEPVPYASATCYLYSGPFLIDHKVVVKALAYVKAYPAQITYAREFALGKAIQPTVVASDGVIFNWSGNMVTLATETSDAEIRYTLDGSEPTETSRLYSAPFAINDTTTVKVKAFKEDWFESETATATFTREWYTVATPVIEPGSMTYENVSQVVSIGCATEGATILYTTDGSDPAANGLEYRKPFSVYSSCTVRAVAVKDDWKNSQAATSTLSRSESLSEAANLYGYTMETDSGAPWTVVTDVSRDGVSSVRSGTIGNNGTTYLLASVKKAGTVSFWWRAACEEADEEDGEDGYYDYGAFLVDDVVVARIAGHDGEWHYVSHEVTSGGKHTLKWEYRKDGATSYAPDCVWVDQVQWIPADGSGYTLTTPEPVPYSWLDEYLLGVGTDYETAGNAASGKMQGGKATRIWEEYVAGTDPTNALSRLEANIEMRDGAPFVSWSPNLNEGGVNARVYTIWGKTNLTDRVWHSPTNESSRFFKVTVEMP
ncbi:MAG: chitobiase/beta-hexosaminidase C-terminal domain-containing protein [Kiritimatiellae bacterium]|nr:chitobiase/beta-hexosaminidase C-terminal domain-containing protein [Kiritimatiellia bacterium]